MHNLPLVCMNRLYGIQKGETIGNEIKVDVHEDDTRWDNFLYVKNEK